MKIDNSKFVHWHCHTEYSALDGLSKVTDVVLEARKMGFPALSITDHGNIGGWVKFIQECAKTKDKDNKNIPYAPIKPILGAEFYLCRNHEYKNKEMQPDGKAGNRHLNVFALNWKGYQNLCTLSNKSWVDGLYYNPRIDLNLLEQHSEGLMIGSACLSSVINANLLYDRYEQARKAVATFKDIFKENFFLEVMYHGIPEEAHIIPDIIKLSSEMGVPIVATNDCHYTHKHQGKTHEVLMCMNTSRCITDTNRIHFPYEEFYLKSSHEMSLMFGQIPNALTNSVGLLDRIDQKDIEDNLFGHQRMPSFQVPEGFKDAFEYLKHLVMQGAKDLGYISSPGHMEDIEKELRDIKSARDHSDLHFDSYFLIIWDIINWARKKNILVGTGRGSGYASLVLRCLKVCYGPDPKKFGLLWERFLGFDELRFVRERDFGFTEKLSIAEKLAKSTGESAELADDERDVEDDQGGVDRY